MDPLLLALLALAALATAALSATFGMAGGLLLMGLYTALLPVPEAMVLHGFTQLVSNGGRAWLLRGHVHRDGLVAYAAGALAAWLALRGVAWTPSEAAVYLGIGAVPFLALALPPLAALDFARRPGAALAGLLVGGAQLAFGVAGPLLDVFFVRSALDRRAVVATKAVTQALSHTLKIGYFAPLVLSALRDAPDAARLGAAPAGAAAGLTAAATTAPALGGTAAALLAAAAVTAAGAVVGTRAGGVLLDRMGEATFRRWTRRLVLGIGAVYLARGALALA